MPRTMPVTVLDEQVSGTILEMSILHGPLQCFSCVLNDECVIYRVTQTDVGIAAAERIGCNSVKQPFQYHGLLNR